MRVESDADTIVSQHARLGDDAINRINKSHRHKVGLRAAFTALTALSTASQAPDSLKLGDRGDGTPAGKEEARQRYAHINDGHVPDIVRHSSPPHCYEFKCFTPFVVNGAIGLGSRARGGAASTTDGGTFAFGNTEEALRSTVLGLQARGSPDEGPMNRRTGAGWVAATTDHDYADAIAKGHGVTLLGTESTGALFVALVLLLRVHAKLATAPGTQDSTVYGTARASPKSYYAHHTAAISSAVVGADAQTIVNEAAHLSFLLSVGVTS